ncbi:MAG: organomercurial lyase MerB [Actinobacteria bacterium]|nr:organomercurial lyase MerB [Frankiales bacterium]MCA0329877.1 organomercurial lyase MerB [Actinomycetota bacterium]
MTNTTTRDVIARLALPEESGLDLAVLIPLLRLLASGDPVDVAALALASALPLDEVRRRLDSVPDTEYDDEGRIVGQGLTLRPTPHRMNVDGQELYTWCALDTLIFPTLLDRAARIESASPTSGEPIRVTVEPAGVTAVEPATAVVSLVNPGAMTSIRSSFCNQVHYFTSAEDAQPWLEQHPGGEVVPVADAYQLGAALTTTTVPEPDTHATPGAVVSADGCCH